MKLTFGQDANESSEKKNRHLEASRAPINELNRLLRLDGQYGAVDVFRHDIASVEQAHRHVLAESRIAAHHLVFRLEARIGHVRNAVLLMERLVCAYDWRK